MLVEPSTPFRGTEYVLVETSSVAEHLHALILSSMISTK